MINYWILWGIPIFDKSIHEAKSLCLIVGKVTNKFVVEKSLTFLAFSAFESAFWHPPIPREFLRVQWCGRIGRLVKVRHRELKQCTSITSFQFELIVQKELWIKLFVAKLKGRYSSILRSFKGPNSLVPKSAEDSWWFLDIFGVGNYRVFQKFLPPRKQSQVRRHYTRDVYVHKAPVDAGPMPNLGRSPSGDSSRWTSGSTQDTGMVEVTFEVGFFSTCSGGSSIHTNQPQGVCEKVGFIILRWLVQAQIGDLEVGGGLRWGKYGGVWGLVSCNLYTYRCPEKRIT